jgi:hypothetical protein
MNLTGVLFFVGYVVVFIAVLFGVIWLERRRRRTRPPFPENLKLLRMPGEYLWRRIIEIDEANLLWFLWTLVLPLVGGGLILKLLAWYLPSSPTLVLTIFAGAFILLLFFSIRSLQSRIRRSADDYLGFIGERYVAEWLDPLKAAGWFIFHDLPCDGANKKFNVDHVAVGPRGIWVVETKTHRKGRAKPGRKAHEVESDGRQVIWPWFEESDSLQQAANIASFLRDWLKTMTGKSYAVSAVLAVPGYLVTERKLGPVRLANPKSLPDMLTSSRNPVLPPADIDLVRRQLEAKCRDVEY